MQVSCVVALRLYSEDAGHVQSDESELQAFLVLKEACRRGEGVCEGEWVRRVEGVVSRCASGRHTQGPMSE